MKKFKFTISGNTYEVEINQFDDNIVNMEVNGTPYAIEVHREVKQSKTPKLVRPAAKQTGSPEIQKKEKGTANAVKAPLPGVILEIFVKSGDIIKKGDKILTMEAMKMENVVQADKDGVVESVKVSQGQSVLQDDVLIEIV